MIGGQPVSMELILSAWIEFRPEKVSVAIPKESSKQQ